MTTGLVAKEWASYRERVVPPDAGLLQVQESRRAFYAGARALLCLLMVGLEPGTEATDADLRRVRGIDKELEAFAEDVKAGRA